MAALGGKPAQQGHDACDTILDTAMLRLDDMHKKVWNRSPCLTSPAYSVPLRQTNDDPTMRTLPAIEPGRNKDGICS
jgi:hypothetical protein